MCRIIVECSTITGSTAYSASGILVKNANFPEEADRNRKRLPSGGRHQSVQSTVLLKRCPRRGDSKLCFRLTKTGRFNGIFRRQTVPQNIAPESQIQPERNCMLQELFIDIFL